MVRSRQRFASGHTARTLRGRNSVGAGWRSVMGRPSPVQRTGTAGSGEGMQTTVGRWGGAIGLFALVVASGVGAAGATAPTGGADVAVPSVRSQEADDDWSGDASVIVEIGPRTSTNDITIDRSGPLAIGELPTDPPSLAPAGELGVAEAAIAQAMDAEPAGSGSAAGGSAAAPTVDGAVAPTSAGEVTTDGREIDGMSTGGQTGVAVEIGDTIPGRGEPGAPGGDAHVVVRVGPLTGGTAVGGRASEGPVEGTGSPGSGVGDATGGAAVGGAADGGEATAEIRIGDTVGGTGGSGQAGGDALVVVHIGPITGGLAAGGAATGGTAMPGSGSARGGDAQGGLARGGDATVDIAVGDTRADIGAAAVLVTVGSLTGGDAFGGDATGGDAWALLGIEAAGGAAAGGTAQGGAAQVELRIDDVTAGSYEGTVGAIVGGDATGGDATGGGAVDIEAEADVVRDR